ncbi:lytic transglycosylase domain-containing protein [Bradyrhizobium sp. AUGA SZCCT0176]|nr:lytic transglycosylase domain-containing protein [Bradyrhizobium sp. AUGA SZCCT0176]MBR1230486.1 lytic transglycosylase domain-containing protein [Bradyrhizobium sp. AUGA SZCCT0182]MBR1299326.1 lytic transglycosylase domain-containing protein [Bradyrhizobium sp. AUGA SZCCT0042]
MKALLNLASFAVVAACLVAPPAAAQQRAQYESLVAAHASANNVPEALVHRVIVRESKYHPDLVGRGGTIGLMQIKLATARGVGYTGDAAGLRDPATNLAYGVKYLAGAWRAANGNQDRAVRLYAGGYYYVAKRQRLERLNQPGPVLASALPRNIAPASDAPVEATEAAIEPKQALKPAEAVEKPKAAATLVPIPKKRPKKLAEAKPQVPHPPDALSGANGAKPR